MVVCMAFPIMVFALCFGERHWTWNPSGSYVSLSMTLKIIFLIDCASGSFPQSLCFFLFFDFKELILCINLARVLVWDLLNMCCPLSETGSMNYVMLFCEPESCVLSPRSRSTCRTWRVSLIVLVRFFHHMGWRWT